jgi:multiple sugar transport system ATP-binding protein
MTLGDQVCVRDAGAVQQVGTPRELYESNVNRFVAGFIGSPAMNFLAADAVDRALVYGALRVPLDDRLRVALDGRRSVVLGIRPDDLGVQSDAADGVRVAVVPQLLEFFESEPVLRTVPNETRKRLPHPAAAR